MTEIAPKTYKVVREYPGYVFTNVSEFMTYHDCVSLIQTRRDEGRQWRKLAIMTVEGRLSSFVIN